MQLERQLQVTSKGRYRLTAKVRVLLLVGFFVVNTADRGIQDLASGNIEE